MSFRKLWPTSAAILCLLTFSTVSVVAAPNILIWQPDFTVSQSGQTLEDDLLLLGEDAVLVDDLFEYSSDLSDHEIVMGVVGFTPDRHVIDVAEGSALDAYVQNGGLLLLEGGDCFDYDPQFGGYDLHAIFGLNDGSDGDGVFIGDILGTGDIAALGFEFRYLGEPSFLDELNPATSTPILVKDQTIPEVLGVVHMSYGAGRAIGLSCEYAGLYDPPSAATSSATQTLTQRQQFLVALLDLLRSNPTAIPSEEAPSLALHPAVPNPFKSGTTIAFELEEATRVRLAIFDVAGRRVRTLVDRFEGRGAFAAHWDGRDGAGNRVASGVYFYTLDTGANVLRRRMVVLK